ncbi:MAG: HAD hydrolase-like protein [Lachnospiraceae bacterium]|nr:HAD hydrolase-like protein [Lachnospiraceae bacterium]
MIRYDYIFLDLDGPILDGRLRHYNCYKDIIEEMGGTPLDIDVYWNNKRRGLNKRIVCEESGISGEYSEFIEKWKNRIEDIKYLKYDVLKPGCLEAIQTMKSVGKKVCLVTLRNNKENLFSQLKWLGIKEIFSEIVVCAGSEINPKYLALNDYVFDKAVLIGDTEIDIEAADMLKIEFIGIINGLRTKSIFEDKICYNELLEINWM